MIINKGVKLSWPYSYAHFNKKYQTRRAKTVLSIVLVKTKVKASIELFFDLSRSLQLCQASCLSIEIVGEKPSGLIGLHESVTYRTRHLEIYENFTSVISG